MLQSEALDLLKLGFNVFLTGAAGAGKTYVLNSYIQYLRRHQVAVAVTASTGIAATHLNGQTVHSWSGIGTRENLSAADLELLAGDKRLRSAVTRAKVLVIDEISMLHARQLTMVEAVTRALRGGGEPFGGLQVILCGDFFQLPPVTKGPQTDKFAFTSTAWDAGGFVVCYLHEQHRQKADPLLNILNDIRSASTGEHTKVPLRTRYRKVPTDAEGRTFEPTRLYAKNVSVDSVNDAELLRISGDSRTFTMTSKGFSAHVEALQRSCLAPKTLVLKVGAAVMFVKNSTEGLYVNGTRGVVESFDPIEGWPEVRTIDGKLVVAEPEDWRFEELGTVRASVTQVPLRLAWAITIHKSQGMTLDAVEVDLSDAFEPGMGYVALSRVRTLNGLKLMGLNEMALKVHPDVLSRDASLQVESERAVARLSRYSQEALDGAKNTVVRGRFAGRDPLLGFGGVDPAPKRKRSRRTVSTFTLTGELLAAGKSLEQIADERGLKVTTVIEHIEKLKGGDDPPDISHLRNSLPAEEFSALFDELRASVDGKLKPVWEKFDGRYSFDMIRLVRLFVH